MQILQSACKLMTTTVCNSSFHSHFKRSDLLSAEVHVNSPGQHEAQAWTEAVSLGSHCRNSPAICRAHLSLYSPHLLQSWNEQANAFVKRSTSFKNQFCVQLGGKITAYVFVTSRGRTSNDREIIFRRTFLQKETLYSRKSTHLRCSSISIIQSIILDGVTATPVTKFRSNGELNGLHKRNLLTQTSSLTHAFTRSVSKSH